MELTAPDVAAAKQFYGSLFDWEIAEMPMGGGMPYTFIKTGQADVGGGMMPPMMPGQPTAWLVYTMVPSVKDSLAKAESLGAKVVAPYMEISGPDGKSMGAIGVIVDPQGAAMGLYESHMPPPPPAAAKKRAAPKKAPAKKAAPKKAPAKKAAPKKGGAKKPAAKSKKKK